MKKSEIVRIKSLSFAYDAKEALSKLNLTMYEGERLGVVGASGSGKSTLLKLIGARLVPNSGAIYFKGQNLDETRNDRVPGHPQIALMSQDFELVPDLSVEENISRSGRHLSASALKRYLGKVKRAFHLQTIRHQKARDLSGGQKQRTALACALISKASLILLDEPFSQLDYQLKQDMLAFLRDEVGGKSLIMVGHEPTDLMRFCHRIAVLDRGKMISVDEIHQIFHYPKNLKVAQMTGMINSLSLEELILTGLSSTLFRPSHVFLKSKGDWSLDRIEYHAFGRLALMRYKDSEIRVWAQLASDRQYKEGSTWQMEIKKP